MINEIVISHRIPIEKIISGEVNYIIRIAEKNKWRPGSIFYLKCSHQDKESMKVIIEDSKEQVAKDISEEVLTKCYYKNLEKFRQQWEKWYQRLESSAWVISAGAYDNGRQPHSSSAKRRKKCKWEYIAQVILSMQIYTIVITNGRQNSLPIETVLKLRKIFIRERLSLRR